MDATILQARAHEARLTSAQQVSAEMGRHGRMSGTELARESGVPYRTLMRCLNGERPFTVDELARIAIALDVPLHRLLVATGQEYADSVPPDRVTHVLAA